MRRMKKLHHFGDVDNEGGYVCVGAESIWEFLCIICFNFVVNIKFPFKKHIKKAKPPNLSLPPDYVQIPFEG